MGLVKRQPSRLKPRSRTAIEVTAEWRKLATDAWLRSGMTQEELGRLVGMRGATVSRILSGVLPANDKVIALADALGVRRPYVIVDDDETANWIALGERLRSAEGRAEALEWLELGLELQAADRATWLEAVSQVRGLAKALREIAAARRRLGKMFSTGGDS